MLIHDSWSNALFRILRVAFTQAIKKNPIFVTHSNIEQVQKTHKSSFCSPDIV